MWVLLFGSLGWNFLEYGAFTDGLVWGWIVCGVVFEAMALGALYVVLPMGGSSWTPPGTTAESPGGHLRWWASYAAVGTIGLALGAWTFYAWS